MKKLFFLLLIVGNIAWAETMINQQYVSAAQTSQPQLQSPFDNTQNSQAQQPQQNNPTAIYTSPSQTQQVLQTQESYNRYTSPSQQQPYQQQAYPNTYSQSQPYQPQPMQQNSPWQTRPQPMQQQYRQPYGQNAYPSQQQAYQQQPQQQPYAQQTLQQPQPMNQYSNNSPMPTSMQSPNPSTMPPSSANATVGSYDSSAQQAWLNNCLKAVTSKEMTPYANAFCQCGWQKITSGGIDPNLFTSQNPGDIRKANALLQGISQQCLLQVMKG